MFCTKSLQDMGFDSRFAIFIDRNGFLQKGFVKYWLNMETNKPTCIFIIAYGQNLVEYQLGSSHRQVVSQPNESQSDFNPCLCHSRPYQPPNFPSMSNHSSYCHPIVPKFVYMNYKLVPMLTKQLRKSPMSSFSFSPLETHKETSSFAQPVSPSNRKRKEVWSINEILNISNEGRQMQNEICVKRLKLESPKLVEDSEQNAFENDSEHQVSLNKPENNVIIQAREDKSTFELENESGQIRKESILPLTLFQWTIKNIVDKKPITKKLIENRTENKKVAPLVLRRCDPQRWECLRIEESTSTLRNLLNEPLTSKKQRRL